MTSTTRAETLPAVQTVFVVVLENHNWADFKGNADAPFLNNTLLPMASYCGQYHNPPQLHPSEPNYLWLEAGTNFGILDDNGPSANHQNTTNHLTAQLRRAGISWKSYQEDIAGNVVPLVPVNGYVPRHDPFVFFDDVTGTNNPYDAYGIAHLRPYSELAGDLASNSVARYNFITPDLCNDGHNSCAPQYDPIRQTDDWLAREIPKIIDSAAYSNNGALFITWDESETGDAPIGLILLSPLARGGGYSNDIYYTHSSLLRTLQKIFGVSPWLGDAANATDLSDLFAQYKISLSRTPTKGTIQLRVSGFASDTTNFVETSTNLTTWSCVSTNWSSSNSFSIEAKAPTNVAWRFYRVRQAP
ncbi:MAG TPA: alkaline phosphatase family protein [Verrucomicrobiae bacterium]|nr:alkaline phosphatase family protein [Verrucomicrobiae bacterium]